jgi:transcriptional regulator with XRE-family HTH domain
VKGISYRDRDYSFGEAMLALRTKVGLTQAGLAQQLGISRRAVGAWEVGASYPSPKHLKHLIELGSQHRAFHPGQEAEEIRLLWASAKLRVPLDETWLAGLLEQALDQPTAPHSSSVGMELSKPRSHVDWGDAPEVSNFYGRENERVFLTEWLLVEHCRVVDAELAGTVLAEAFHFPSSVALSGDGALLAAGTLTGQVWLWRVADRPLLWAMQAQTGAVWGMALSADGQLVASASLDGTVKLWGAKSGACLRTLRAERRYERMDISGLFGITAAQRASLIALGAVDAQSVGACG